MCLLEIYFSFNDSIAIEILNNNIIVNIMNESIIVVLFGLFSLQFEFFFKAKVAFIMFLSRRKQNVT